MSETGTCALCGDPIDPGQAWLEDDADPPSLAHAGCVYSAGDDGGAGARWHPAEVG